MKKNKDKLLEYIRKSTSNDESVSFTTMELADAFHLARANVSTSLNQLVNEGHLKKTDGRPTRYYLKHDEKMEDAFSQLIGSDGSLKNSIRLAKAFLLYPEDVSSFVISGEYGTGKEKFAYAMYEYAKANHAIREDTELEIYDISQYDQDDDIFNALWNKKKGDRFLLLKHVEKVSLSLQRRFHQGEAQKDAEQKIIVVCSEETGDNKGSVKYESDYPFQARLSSLTERPLTERLELIESFFQKESLNVHKDIVINSELLRCLLLYQCDQNIKQLKNDIKIACANSFVRQRGSDFDKLYVFLSDCHSYVRKGFLNYRDKRQEIEQLIPDNYTYTYSYTNSKVQRTDERGDHESIYQYIDEKVNALKKRKISDEDIQTIISDEIESGLSLAMDHMVLRDYDVSALEKIIDPEIVHSVEGFLKDASVRFHRVYSLSIFQTLCIQINGAMKEDEKTNYISKEKITDVMYKYPNEYAYTKRFASSLEKRFDVHLSVDDTVLMTLALCHQKKEVIQQNIPHILVIMHGNTASSIRDVVNTLYEDANVYSYDLLLDSDLNMEYDRIKEYCLKIPHAEGLLVFYDMGSLKKIMEMISMETGARMKMIEMPMSLIVLAASFELSSGKSLNDTYEHLISQGFGSFDTLKNEIQRKDAFDQKYIIALCMSGSGAALQIKQYIEKNLDLGNTKVVALALNDHNAMMDALNYYSRTGEIQCIVGTYDPKVYDVPYISIAQLFNTPADKLDLLLAVNYNTQQEEFNYKELYDYLDEQLERTDIHKIKQTIHQTIRQMKKKIRNVDHGEEVGLFVHIACAIERIKTDSEPYINASKDKIISKHKRMYNDLKDILEDLEVDAEVAFTDDEIATIMEILG